MHHVMYQAVVCHEELDCAERGRAIHLNPLRAGIGADGRELHRSPDGGHSAVVGEAEWVEASVNQAKEHDTRQTAWTRRGVGFEHRVARVAAIVRVEPHDVVAQGRQRRRVDDPRTLGGIVALYSDSGKAVGRFMLSVLQKKTILPSLPRISPTSASGRTISARGARNEVRTLPR